MPTDAVSLFLFTESPLHPGAGSTLSYIDLPVQRESFSTHPIAPASGVKGALRDAARGESEKLGGPYLSLFGPETDGADKHGGLGIFQEARICLLPVATFQDVYVWVTSPMVLNRLKRDYTALLSSMTTAAQRAASAFLALTIPAPADSEVCAPTKCPALQNKSLVLAGEYRLNASTANCDGLSKWFSSNALPTSAEYKWWRDRLENSVVVVDDSTFTHLARIALHYEIHVKIGTEGTVEDGPWLEESIPPDTLLTTNIVLPPALATIVKEQLGNQTARQHLTRLLSSRKRMQFGGGRSTGMGWVALNELGGAA